MKKWRKLSQAQRAAYETLADPRQTDICLYGGARCLAGHMILDGNTATIAEQAAAGLPVLVRTACGERWASPPTCVGRGPLLRVTTRAGKILVVSPGHRFWSDPGWRMAESLRCGDHLYGLAPAVTDEVLSIETAGYGEHYTLTVPLYHHYAVQGLLNHNSGKTLLCLRALLVRAVKSPGSNHAVVRRFLRDVKQKIGQVTLPDVMDMCFPGTPYDLNKADWIVTLPNKSRIWLCGLDDDQRADKILGSEFSTLLFEEASQIAANSVDVAKTRLAEKNDLRKVAYYTLNPVVKTHWAYQRFLEDRLPRHACAQINPKDNLDNIDPDFIARLESLPARDRQRFLEGEWQERAEGALFQWEWVTDNRAEACPGTVDRLVVAVDPSITGKSESDDTGVVALAKCGEHTYILDDATCSGSPAQWAETVLAVQRRVQAATVVVEANQGGEMAATILQQLDDRVKVDNVWAHRSKLARAEPVAALYEKGLVHHVGELPELESELMTYDGTGSSPNRMDALVHGVLFLQCGQRQLHPSFGAAGPAEKKPPPPAAEPDIDDDRLWESM